MVLRFGNGIFEPIWNRHYVDHVQITVAEALGVEGRGEYYEEAGAIRDMIQNHMMQLLTLTAMEPPATFDADAVRDEKVKVLRAIAPLHRARDRAGYGARAVRPRIGRWQARARLPRGGRRRARFEHRDLCRAQAAHRQLALGRRAVLPAHRQAPDQARHRDRHPVQAAAVPAVPRNGGGPMEPNVLSMRIQPDEGISLRFIAKVPGRRCACTP